MVFTVSDFVRMVSGPLLFFAFFALVFFAFFGAAPSPLIGPYSPLRMNVA